MKFGVFRLCTIRVVKGNLDLADGSGVTVWGSTPDSRNEISVLLSHIHIFVAVRVTRLIIRNFVLVCHWS